MKWYIFILTFIVSACGEAVSPLTKVTLDRISSIGKPYSYGTLLESTPPELFEKFDFKIIYINSQIRKTETFMKLAGENSGVETWIGADGSSIQKKQGIVVGSRGFGDDLVVAVRPTWPDLLSYAQTGSEYASIYRHWSEDERIETSVFICSVLSTHNELIEQCYGKDVYFSNTYKYNARELISSRQWMSAGLGYIHYEKMNF
jgi:hypothetical protein